MKLRSLALVVVPLLLLASCQEQERKPPPPPPPPPAAAGKPPPEVPAPEPAEANTEKPAASGQSQPKEKKARERAERVTSKAKVAPQAPAPPAPPAPPTPTPAAQHAKPPAPEKAKSAVVVPSTKHVRIELPRGLQADLDHDPRMQPWVNQLVSAIDKCYAPLRDSGASGVIEVRVVMHENERPSAQPVKLPAQLTSLAGCATSAMLRAKMPLFTGTEGEPYTVKIQLSK